MSDDSLEEEAIFFKRLLENKPCDDPSHYLSSCIPSIIFSDDNRFLADFLQWNRLRRLFSIWIKIVRLVLIVFSAIFYFV